jgi:hypothetical protein
MRLRAAASEDAWALMAPARLTSLSFVSKISFLRSDLIKTMWRRRGENVQEREDTDGLCIGIVAEAERAREGVSKHTHLLLCILERLSYEV